LKEVNFYFNDKISVFNSLRHWLYHKTNSK